MRTTLREKMMLWTIGLPLACLIAASMQGLLAPIVPLAVVVLGTCLLLLRTALQRSNRSPF